MKNSDNDIDVSFEVCDGDTVDFDTDKSNGISKHAFERIKQARKNNRVKEKQHQSLSWRIKRAKRFIIAVLVLAFLMCVAIEYIRTSSINYVKPGTEYNDQDNSIRSAKRHLELAPYSRSGLINMLEYEGYSTEDAENAVNHCGANWKKQAYKEAQDYLEYIESSEAQLREHLEYDGFTEKEIDYAVKKSFK